MAFTVRGRTVLVTGAGMGMGRLYAERAAREGAGAVVLWDIDARALEDVVAHLAPHGATVHSYVVDVGSVESIRAAAAAVLNDVGVPDVLVNNAGIVRGAYFWEHDHLADIDLTLRVNAAGPMHVARAFLPAMIAQGRAGRILNVASASGTLSVPRMSVYAASKWAVIGWSDSLRLELRAARHPIAVTTLIPSYIRTGMFEGARGPLMTPLMEPEYVVDRAWNGMLGGRARVQLPWTVQLAGTLRAVLPQPVWDVVAGRVLRIYSSMDHFTGRQDGPASETKDTP
ncbi:SDR family NAD(P)-dependent oxidoreductase [Arthrobacter bussei]|uniref:SDR family NAD(P)-dependent oxidoreductase n=1 Tax=Arthrobacter bussei TaxID=2594179 RepID=A0A7X1NSP6_9MICC|nr:SDR family NAD(P)-dependent oxidoreductase [Arthrobacter bussei]MPY12110.1 SDR family NAD(P)-dependent oxidoreductase [Arthrobacter bussei]